MSSRTGDGARWSAEHPMRQALAMTNTLEAPPRVAAIEADSLTKTFGRVRAVDGISLHVEPGEIVAFLGPNGAGKTTTIDMLLGLTKPDSGTVSIYGQTPRSAIAHGLVSAVMQTGGLLQDVTVRETVQLT